jgi:hypothetical protein
MILHTAIVRNFYAGRICGKGKILPVHATKEYGRVDV